ncbi:MAG: T9SS type A sorting domain-containing protein [Bacteroidetes bacterium]|nr:T9SS type A sorting domain-containing protein [Bacteroidota bacterium]
MKTTGFLTVLLFAFQIVFSQSLSLIYDGNPIPANHQIVIQSHPNAGEVIVDDILVKNNSANYLLVKAKKIENYLIPETVNTFCWAGLCYAPNVYISPLYDTLFAGETTLPGEFAGHYNPQTHPGESSISYVFFDMNNPNDSVMVTVLYDATLTGIQLQGLSRNTISDPYPNPANQFVRFDYQISEPILANLKIYSLIGSLVSELTLSSVQGTIQVETVKLEEGFYFFVLQIASSEVKTGRFMVKH